MSLDSLSLNIGTWRILYPWVILLWLLPILLQRYVWKTPRVELPDQALVLPRIFHAYLRDTRATNSTRRSQWQILLLWLLLLCALARPQQLGDPKPLETQARQIMLAIDSSGSMEAPDMVLNGQRYSRFAAVKAVASEFIKRRQNDFLGLILFGEKAYLQAPLTHDYQTVSTLLDESFLGIAGEKRTAFGDAIVLAVKKMRAHDQALKQAKSNVLILLTDGRNNAGVEPLRATTLAKDMQLTIYTIGVGGKMDSRSGLARLMGMGSANSELDEVLMRKIAEQTGGRYFRAQNIASLQQIYAEIDRIETNSENAKTYQPIREWYFVPLLFALAWVVLQSWLSVLKRQPFFSTAKQEGK